MPTQPACLCCISWQLAACTPLGWLYSEALHLPVHLTPCVVVVMLCLALRAVGLDRASFPRRVPAVPLAAAPSGLHRAPWIFVEMLCGVLVTGLLQGRLFTPPVLALGGGGPPPARTAAHWAELVRPTDICKKAAPIQQCGADCCCAECECRFCQCCSSPLLPNTPPSCNISIDSLHAILPPWIMPLFAPSVSGGVGGLRGTTPSNMSKLEQLASCNQPGVTLLCSLTALTSQPHALRSCAHSPADAHACLAARGRGACCVPPWSASWALQGALLPLDAPWCCDSLLCTSWGVQSLGSCAQVNGSEACMQSGLMGSW
jgi:hypothetical protein